MSSLSDTEKRYLEFILDMGGGYVLDYTDGTFGEFFRRYGVDIHGAKYQSYGTSKAKKLRGFWEREADAQVGRVLAGMLDAYEAKCDLSGKEIDQRILEKSRGIVGRLLGKAQEGKPVKPVDGFLREEITLPDIRKLPVEPAVLPIVEERIEEVRRTLAVRAYLSVVVLCGSILEAVLLGNAQKEPGLFNRSRASPKGLDGKVKRFQDWTLAQFIDVASDVGILKPDVRKFSHGLRDFRNYIHPYQQLVSGFTPDEHTATVCFQVLKAALASVAGARG